MAFHVLWTDRFAFAKTVAGTVEGTGPIRRIVPLRYPDSINLIAQRLTIEGVGRPVSAVQPYTAAKITVYFEFVPWLIQGNSNPFLAIRLKFGGNYVTMPGTAFKFASDSTPIKQDMGVFVPEVGYNITIYQGPTLDDATITSLVGKINSTIFLNNPVKTMRFDGADADYSMTFDGQQQFTKQFAFTYRAKPWGQILRPDGVWEEAVNVTDGSLAYETAELKPLLYGETEQSES